MPFRLIILSALLTGASPASGADPLPPPPGPHYAEATVETAKTSIYIGSVTLAMPPFRRVGEGYESSYTAKVFPFFFASESGRITIDLSDDELRRIAAGESLDFTGRAEESGGDPRRIEGRIAPDDAASGQIKVRVWVSPRIELIFNTTYRFTGSSG